MKLKSVVMAIAAVVLSAAVQAGNADLGTLAVPSSSTGSVSMPEGSTLDDTWNFTTLVPSFASASATNNAVGQLTVALYGLNPDTFSATLDGVALSAQPFGGVGVPGQPFWILTQTLTIAPFLIQPGAHTLKFSGEVIGVNGGGYTATLALAAAPVPEPETYAMMLAGLAALGFLARRRQA